MNEQHDRASAEADKNKRVYAKPTLTKGPILSQVAAKLIGSEPT